ncbi:MAG: hypothetical protein ACK4GN_15060 [Runella sp.]
MDNFSLWQAFQTIISKEWSEKYAALTGNDTFSGFLNVKKNKMALSKQIYEDIKKTLEESQLPVDDLPSQEYFHNMLKVGLTKDSHPKTVEMIRGYVDIKKELLSLEKTSKKIPYRKAGLIAGGIGLALLSVWGYNMYWSRNFTKAEKQYFKNLIDSAGITEFNLYLTLDTTKIKDLDQYFTYKGQAKRNVLGELEKPIRKGYRVRPLQSHRSILDWEFVSKEENEIRIQTKEKWKLVHYDPNTGEDLYKYDTTNSQLYILLKEHDQWKIDVNDYAGVRKKVVDK